MRLTGAAAALALSAVACACSALPSASGSFERTLTVTGPVHLQLTNGSGDTRILRGASSQVHILGEFRMWALPWENVGERANELAKDPPVKQDGDLIHIGGDLLRQRNTEINYAIEVPAETEIKLVTGSGSAQVAGIRGPATLIAGSGEITAHDITEDTQATAGSGEIHLSEIQGEVQATAGSGDIRLANIGGAIRVHAGSGDIAIVRPGSRVSGGTGSGDISVTNAGGDLRLRTGSGDINVNGNPAADSYWEFHTGSGDVSLHTSSAASFRLYAHSHMGNIHAALPLVIEEQISKHELRARYGDGRARIEIETASGSIAVQ